MVAKSKLEFLDGIRGVCALYVALYHAQLFTGYGIDKEYVSGYMEPISYILSFGHYSVTIFIVLSGFCLMIPVALSSNKTIRGGFELYIKRRANRILPPYYFALAFSLILIATIPILQTPHGTAWDSKIPVDFDSIISHIFLVHNFSLNWVNKINGPMWSVATEWQIYFFFPVLLYLWRKGGYILSLVTAMLVGLLPRLLLPLNQNQSWMHPWYIGLFAMGMGAALIVFSSENFWTNFRLKVDWKLTSRIMFTILIILLTVLSKWIKLSVMTYEIVVGFVFCTLLIHYSLIEIKTARRSLLHTFFNAKWTILLGSFSYSIYLVHSPLLGLINLSILNVNMSSNLRLIFMIFVATPTTILISYLFYLLVERRYMSNPVKIHKERLGTDVSLSEVKDYREIGNAS